MRRWELRREVAVMGVAVVGENLVEWGKGKGTVVFYWRCPIAFVPSSGFAQPRGSYIEIVIMA